KPLTSKEVSYINPTTTTGEIAQITPRIPVGHGMPYPYENRADAETFSVEARQRVVGAAETTACPAPLLGSSEAIDLCCHPTLPKTKGGALRHLKRYFTCPVGTLPARAPSGNAEILRSNAATICRVHGSRWDGRSFISSR